MATEPKAATEEAKIDLFEDDDEFEEFEINQGYIMASASSNATSGWPMKVCACGVGPCIPTKAGPNAKNPGRYYYKCPVTNPCMQRNGWCDNNNQNVSHLADDRTCDFTRPFPQYNVELNNNLRELISTIRNAVRVVVIQSFIGIVICVALVMHLLYR